MDAKDSPFRAAKAEQTCFVYDARTGFVVHIHQFCPLEAGGRCSEDEMERTALALAPSDVPQDQLAAFHHSGDIDLPPGHLYYFDAETQGIRSELMHTPQGREDRHSAK